jgi:hypothetical protein
MMGIFVLQLAVLEYSLCATNCPFCVVAHKWMGVPQDMKNYFTFSSMEERLGNTGTE